MDHKYIDDHSVAERYLTNALPPVDRDAFERHMVDCPECNDRILLASAFHAHGHVVSLNGAVSNGIASNQAVGNAIAAHGEPEHAQPQQLLLQPPQQPGQSPVQSPAQPQPPEHQPIETRPAPQHPAMILRLRRSTLIWIVAISAILLLAIPFAVWLAEQPPPR